MERLTLDKAKEILANNEDVQLCHGSWMSRPIGGTYKCCGVGLVVLEKMGDAYEAHRLVQSAAGSCSILADSFNEYVRLTTEVLAAKTELPLDYLCGLNNGFEPAARHQIESEDTELYREGIEDGKALLTLLPEGEEDGHIQTNDDAPGDEPPG